MQGGTKPSNTNLVNYPKFSTSSALASVIKKEND